MTTPGSGSVAVSVTDGIGTLTFQHPKSNSLPGALLTQLAAEVTRLGQDRATRVILLRSEGKAFCGGASFDELRAIKTPEQGTRFFSGFQGLILAMIAAPKFVVTRVQGRTVGGGVGLVAASDYALAAAGASVKLSELAVGIGPFVVGPVIEKRIGLGAFAAMAVDADWREASWAREQGLYAQLLPDEASLDAAVATLTERLAASNPEAMARLKRVFWEGIEHWPALLADRAAMSGTLVLSEFTRKAIGG